MFRVIEYINDSGKIRMTIETTDQITADFLRFFGAADKFVELFHFRMRMGKGVDRYKKTLPDKLRIVQKEQATQLKRFRELSGSRAERLRVLKEIRTANGEKVTLDLIDAEIRHAMKREKELLRARIQKMRAEGKSVAAISRATKIPVPTIYLHLKKKSRPPENPPERPPATPRIVSSDEGA